MKVEIEAKARLHLSLLSMHLDGPRINGGVGFAISEPKLKVSAEKATSISIHDIRNKKLSVEETFRLINTLNEVSHEYGLKYAAEFTISGMVSPHLGFGSGTATRLACIEALMVLNGVTIDKDTMIRLSSRGGTSGIGINTYFHGGCVLDLGKINNGLLLPSSQLEINPIQPLLLKQFEMPDWKLGILIPSDINPLNTDQERKFFNKTCPIAPQDSYEAFYYSIAGVFASVLEKDKATFESSLKKLQKCQWKGSERNLHGDSLIESEKAMYEAGATAVGMSSIGPCLFFFAPDVPNVISKLKKSHPEDNIFMSSPDNIGRTVTCLS